MALPARPPAATTACAAQASPATTVSASPRTASACPERPAPPSRVRPARSATRCAVDVSPRATPRTTAARRPSDADQSSAVYVGSVSRTPSAGKAHAVTRCGASVSSACRTMNAEPACATWRGVAASSARPTRSARGACAIWARACVSSASRTQTATWACAWRASVAVCSDEVVRTGPPARSATRTPMYAWSLRATATV